MIVKTLYFTSFNWLKAPLDKEPGHPRNPRVKREVLTLKSDAKTLNIIVTKAVAAPLSHFVV